MKQIITKGNTVIKDCVNTSILDYGLSKWCSYHRSSLGWHFRTQGNGSASMRFHPFLDKTSSHHHREMALHHHANMRCPFFSLDWRQVTSQHPITESQHKMPVLLFEDTHSNFAQYNLGSIQDDTSVHGTLHHTGCQYLAVTWVQITEADAISPYTNNTSYVSWHL